MLPSGCHVVCRPNRTSPRRFTTADVLRVARYAGDEVQQLDRAQFLALAYCGELRPLKETLAFAIQAWETRTPVISETYRKLRDIAETLFSVMGALKGILGLLRFVPSVRRSLERMEEVVDILDDIATGGSLGIAATDLLGAVPDEYLEFLRGVHIDVEHAEILWRHNDFVSFVASGKCDKFIVLR